MKEIFIKKANGMLEELDAFSEDFWKDQQATPETIKLKFSQQGYEEKGHGHIKQIIANVHELLYAYFENLYYLNSDTLVPIPQKEVYISNLIDAFKPNLIFFYLAAHLHDIGMKFPRIFESLAKLLPEEGGLPPEHLGKIIYDHHHYASFIILMEMSCFIQGENWSASGKYLKNVSTNEKAKIEKLNEKLWRVYVDYLINNKLAIKFKDFKVILAILCLLHKEYKDNTVQSIMRNINTSAVSMFNTWWEYFERGKKWTEKMNRRFERSKSTDSLFGSASQLLEGELLKYGNDSFLDLPLVEALLQYGDKTEISIARLGRNEEVIALEAFLEDTKYDYQEGYLCIPMAKKVISDFARARACYFIPVLMVNVETSWVEREVKGKDLPEDIPQLNIVIHYLRFDRDGDIFKFIRYQNEKEFYDLDFLQVIRFHVPAIIHFKEPPVQKGEFKMKNPVFEIKLKKEEHLFEKIAIVTFPDTAQSSSDFDRVKGVLKCFKDSKPLIEDIIKRIILPGKTIKSEDFNPDLEFKAELKTFLENLMDFLDIIVISRVAQRKLNSVDSIIRFLQKLQCEKMSEAFRNEFSKKLKKLRSCSKQDDDFSKNFKEIENFANCMLIRFEELLSKGKKNDRDILIVETDAAETIKKSLEGLRGKKDELKNLKTFQYSEQNRGAIQKIAGNAKKEGSKKEAFFKTSDSDVPVNFEVMAILNLLYQED